MKKIIYLLLVASIVSCSSEEDLAPTVPVVDVDEGQVMNWTLIKTGTIRGIGHTASGTASVYNDKGQLVVLLNPYSSQNGPDLKVYLSKDADASEYIRLGNLKSTMGSQSYTVPGTPDLNEYNYVHVWCERYTVVFARAELK